MFNVSLTLFFRFEIHWAVSWWLVSFPPERKSLDERPTEIGSGPRTSCRLQKEIYYLKRKAEDFLEFLRYFSFPSFLSKNIECNQEKKHTWMEITGSKSIGREPREPLSVISQHGVFMVIELKRTNVKAGELLWQWAIAFSSWTRRKKNGIYRHHHGKRSAPKTTNTHESKKKKEIAFIHVW